MKKQQVQSVSRELVVGVAALLLGVGGATWWFTQNPEIDQPTPPGIQQPRPTVNVQPQAYWLQGEGTLVPQKIAIQSGATPELALKEAFRQLLDRPRDAKLNTAIPAGTRLLSLKVTEQGIYVDLSKEFAQGGGSTIMTHRVAQAIYTATSLNPEAKVYLSVEGQALDEEHPLGGEGLIISQPTTRQKFTEDFPGSPV
jgi:spore germination protein GerM